MLNTDFKFFDFLYKAFVTNNLKNLYKPLNKYKNKYYFNSIFE